MKRVNWPRLFLLGGSTVLSWLAGSSQPPSVQPTSVSRDVGAVNEFPVPVRLQNWRGPSPVVARPERNVFSFRERAGLAGTKSTQPAAGVVADAPAPTPSIPFKLIGMAQDQGESATAIISGHGQVLLVKQGDVVPPTYTVVSIAADSVELTDRTTGATIRLFMK